ncbi:MAG TPA: hypothetical protein PK156_16775 [Polyangium sp.]|nr:hypothetical protein [Polyangium sp.]
MNSKERDVLGVAGRRTWRRRLATFAVFGAISMGGASAWAQVQLTYQSPSMASRSPDNRSGTANLRWIINFDECMKDGATMSFNLNVTGFTATTVGSFEVWGATQNAIDCSLPENRNTGAAGDTKPCFALKHTGGPSAGQTQSAFTITVKLKDLVAAHFLDKTIADDCRVAIGNSVPQPLNVQFMFMSGGTVVGDRLIWPPQGTTSTIDLWGPQPPTNVIVTSSDGAVDLTVEGEPGETQTTVVVYCAKDGKIVTNTASSSDSCGCSNVGDDSGSGGSGGTTSGNGGTTNGFAAPSNGLAGAGGTSGMGGAGGSGGGSSGAGGTGGAGGSSSGSLECTTEPLQPNKRPEAEWTPCAEGTTVDGLENNQVVALGVAYRDQVGNAGVLAPIVCATPEPIEDFFENYQKSGGTAGGGFCSISPRALRNTSFGSAFALGFLALVWRRRNRLSRNASVKEVSK